MKYISDIRTNRQEWWGTYVPYLSRPHNVDHDLVKMSYIEIDQFFEPTNNIYTAQPNGDRSNVDLYIFGDSYVLNLPDSIFYSRRVQKGWRDKNTLVYTLDTAQKNILILQFAERFFRDYLQDLRIYNAVKQGAQAAKSSQHGDIIDASGRFHFFNSNINQNLEFNLFNYNFLRHFRISKAKLNYHIFDRASGGVVLAKDKNWLFLKRTTDKKDGYSSYYPFSTEEKNNIVNNLNEIYRHYRNAGFEEIYLSLIPNPCGLVEPEGYNNLVPMIESDSNLLMPVLSLYQKFKLAPNDFYCTGDSHWKNAGMQVWVQSVNTMLEKFDD